MTASTTPISALHLIQAVELLNEVSKGDAEPCIRRPLVSVAASLKMVPELAVVACFMMQYAHGEVGHDLAGAHIGTIKTFASRFMVG